MNRNDTHKRGSGLAKRNLVPWGLLLLFLTASTGCDDDENSEDNDRDASVCYTPCKTGAEINGEYAPCSDEGLIRGCFGEAVCKKGWCVSETTGDGGADASALDGEDAGVRQGKAALRSGLLTRGDGKCIDDCGCASHGACIDGQCTVQCEEDSDCRDQEVLTPVASSGCHLKVCRQICTSVGQDEGAQPCPVDTHCVIGADGVNGHCMPSCAPEADRDLFRCLKSTAGDRPPFELTGKPPFGGSFAFSESTTDATFTLTNNTRCALDFVVRRKAHAEYTDEGIDKVETNPLHWLRLESGGVISEGGSTLVIPNVAPNRGEAQVTISRAANPKLPNWRGTLEVGVAAKSSGEELGQEELNLSFSSGVNGRWSGSMYYFGNFGTRELEEWRDSGFSETELQKVGNGFIRRWGVLRRGAITLDNFMAAVTSTLSGSWKWSTVSERCPLPNGACYPFSNPLEDPDDGIEEFSDDLKTAPIPSGMAELPVAVNLRAESGSSSLKGKIVSSETLHYAGSPNMELTMAMPADTCEKSGILCRNMVTDLKADIVVGGRYSTQANDGSCDSVNGFPLGFVEHKVPWLLLDFTGESALEDDTRYYYECRDALWPYEDGSSLLQEGTVAAAVNQGFAGSNPLPDSRSLSRELTVVDGALFNKELLFIIFEERFVVPMGDGLRPEDFSGYGFMMLRRSPERLDPATDYTGSDQRETRSFPDDVLRPECSPKILTAMKESSVTSDNANDVAAKLINGSVEIDPETEIDPSEIYYLCWETGLVAGGTPINDINDIQSDAGVDTDTDTGLIPDALAKDECRGSSNVTFFYFEGCAEPAEPPDEWKCYDDAVFGETQTEKRWNNATKQYEKKKVQIVTQRGTCDQLLQQWQAEGLVVVNPVQRCADETRTTCDGESYDRRIGIKFYRGASNDGTDFGGIRTEVRDAFRYKTAFRSRSGKELGFSPDICSDTHGAVPYCYDPDKIEQIQQRTDCALALLSNSNLSVESFENLNNYLTESFKSACIYREDDEYTGELCARPEFQEDGFEALNAELLIMLGDDAYTNSFASRFDLAATNTASFEGSLFEEGGIDLSGAAGNEMYNLYRATQYYQLALDRFYSLMPAIYRSMGDTAHPSFITAETVTSYFDRLIRASTQKARAWSEIAERYQSFNRPELARHVIERAYTATYLESVLITRLMYRVIDIVPTADEAQIVYIIEQAQLRYKASLLELGDINRSIEDDVNYFGFPPDYIPFPAVDEGDYAEGNTNAFDKLRDSTMALIEFAAAKEELAIASKKDYEVDEAAFQSELASIRNSYESELADLCGTFEGDDGYIYPAILEHAEKNEQSRIIKDPCGQMGTGAIDDAVGQAQMAALEVRKANTRRNNKIEEIKVEMERVNLYCQAKIDFANYIWQTNAGIITLETVIGAADIAINALNRAADMCYAAAGADPLGWTTLVWWAGGLNIGLSALLETAQLGMKTAIMALENGKELGYIMHDCDIEQINSMATMSTLALELSEIDLDILEAGKNMEMAVSEITRLTNEAKRLYVEYQETNESAINVAAAMTDPNTRIYKNDAIINADKAFWTAVREAYKATKVYEYYTSTSYAHLVDLFLVRMVSAGDYNLENYMMELDTAFYEFEEQYGNPDLRLAIVSLRDDIFDIPTISETRPGVALSAEERAALFVQKLTDPQWLDGHGYIRIPFGTRLDEVSPLTRNHKINYIEAEIQGEVVGDSIGRVYLTQKGTGTVRTVEGEKQYYSFPERIAVVNTFFNGEKEMDADTILHTAYENNRFFDRPFANSDWELAVNTVDEAANADIDLSTLTDVRLYIYYTDFTAMP